MSLSAWQVHIREVVLNRRESVMVRTFGKACPRCGGDLELIEVNEPVLVCPTGDYSADAKLGVLVRLMLEAVEQNHQTEEAM